MNKKNGFTLIELLAIIVILAIVAVITVPIILNIIDNSKKGAAQDSALGYKAAIQKDYISQVSEKSNTRLNGTYTVEDGKLIGIFDGENTESRDIPVSGTKPSSGELTYSNNVLTGGWLVVGDYKITFEATEIASTEKYTNSEPAQPTIKPLNVNVQAVGNGEVRTDITVNITNEEDKPETVIYKYYINGTLESTSTNNTYVINGGWGEQYEIRVEVTDGDGNILGSGETSASTPQCFVAGTQVLTETGMRNIEDIIVGEKVYALNPDNNQKELKEVLSVYTGKSSETYEITIGGEKVISTPRHKFYIVDKGWIRAYDLSVGDRVSAKDNTSLVISEIKLVKHEEPVNVYNLVVEDIHTYLITNSELLVHNGGSPT